jgi:hypothetical protein
MPPKKQDNKNDKLDELIEKLEERLSIFNENELKERCAKLLVDMKYTIAQLEEQHQKFYELLGLTYQDIHYPS